MLAIAEPSLETAIFLLAHGLFFGWFLVFEAAKMQSSVEYYPVQLVLVGYSERMGVFIHTVDADINLTRQRIIRLAHIEGDYVSERVMVEELLIYFQQVGIVAKDVGEVDFYKQRAVLLHQ